MATVFSERMAAADAQLLWLSAKVPNDQFLVYVFDGTPDIPAAVDEVRRTAGGYEELRLRVCDDHSWRYPRWVSGPVGAEQFAVHPAIERGARFFAFYVNKGSIPYGEHEPWSGGHASNGKDALAAVLFGLQDNQSVAT